MADTNKVEGSALDRGITPLAGSASSMRTRRLIGIGAVLAGGSVLAYLTLATGQKTEKTPPPTTTPTRTAEIDFRPATRPEQSPPGQSSPPARGAPTPQTAPPPQGAAPAPAGGQSAQPDAAAKARAEAVTSPVIAAGGGAEHGATSAQSAPAGAALAEPDQTPLAAQLKATKISGSAAGRLPDRNLLITASSHFQCVLDTALDSTHPGFTRCHLPIDVLSDNGLVVLLEKGSRIIGQYQGGLKQGQARIAVLWTRIETPTGVIIDLDSPATDALGRAGFDGQIDTHFFERFGGALLLSIVDDSFATFAASQQHSGTISETNTTGAAQSGAATALQPTISIPPTLTKDQGEEVAVFVARDLDFRGVYQLTDVTR